jgi:hypothetical protein
VHRAALRCRLVVVVVLLLLPRVEVCKGAKIKRQGLLYTLRESRDICNDACEARGGCCAACTCVVKQLHAVAGRQSSSQINHRLRCCR